jgi:hypothetical protein
MSGLFVAVIKKRHKMKKILAILTVMLVISAPVIAQEIDYCEGDFDCDGDCDGTDASVFKSDFGRSNFQNPCPAYPPNLIYFDDFNDGDADGWWLGYSLNNPSVFGNWRIEDIGPPHDGTLVQDVGSDAVIALVKNLQIATQTVEVQLKMKQVSGVGGLTLWYQDNNNWIRVHTYPAASFTSLSEHLDGTKVGEYTHTHQTSNGVWYELKVVADSITGILKVYLDDELLFTYESVTPNRIGQSGLTTSNSGAYFDDFTITNSSITIPSGCPYNMVDCGTKCVDPMTDENYCGVDTNCLLGAVCGTSERCVLGVCEDVGGSGYPAPVPKTGQTTSYATGDDGDLETGIAWPNPRFTDNSDGTVTDNLTGLIWLKDANCLAMNYPELDNDNTAGDGRVTWQHALDFVAGINDGTYPNCGAGSTEWRLPNRNELASLVHKGYYGHSLPNTVGTGQWSEGDPFNNVPSGYYWASTTGSGYTGSAWGVDMYNGYVFNALKTTYYYYVWPVRGPE